MIGNVRFGWLFNFFRKKIVKVRKSAHKFGKEQNLKETK